MIMTLLTIKCSNKEKGKTKRKIKKNFDLVLITINLSHSKWR